VALQLTGEGDQVSVRSEQAARTEAELQAAAVRVFAQRGYLTTKITDITDITAEAGRATGSFYKHFTGEEKLLESLLARLFEQSDEAVAAAGNHPEDFRDRDAVRWHVETFVRAFREHRTVMVALQQAATVDETFARRQSELFRPDLEHLADHLDHRLLASDDRNPHRLHPRRSPRSGEAPGLTGRECGGHCEHHVRHRTPRCPPSRRAA